MVQLEQEREKIERAKEIIKTTDSPHLKRDLQKYIKRAERQIKQALFLMKGGGLNATWNTSKQLSEPEKGQSNAIRR